MNTTPPPPLSKYTRKWLYDSYSSTSSVDVDSIRFKMQWSSQEQASSPSKSIRSSLNISFQSQAKQYHPSVSIFKKQSQKSIQDQNIPKKLAWRTNKLTKRVQNQESEIGNQISKLNFTNIGESKDKRLRAKQGPQKWVRKCNLIQSSDSSIDSQFLDLESPNKDQGRRATSPLLQTRQHQRLRLLSFTSIKKIPKKLGESMGQKVAYTQPRQEKSHEIIILLSDQEDEKSKELCVIDLESECSSTRGATSSTTPYFSHKSRQYFYSKRQFALIGPKEFQILNSKLFLNDNIIMSYLYFLATEIIHPEIRRDIYICDAFLYEKLSSRNVTIDTFLDAHNFVKREQHLFRKGYWLIPICSRSHWLLVIVQNPGEVSRKEESETNLFILDSLPRSNYQPIVSQISKFIHFEYGIRFLGLQNETRSHLRETRKLRKILAKTQRLNYELLESPLQTNHYDCGLHLLQNAELFLSNPEQFLQFESGTQYCEDILINKRVEIAKLFKMLAEDKDDIVPQYNEFLEEQRERYCQK